MIEQPSLGIDHLTVNSMPPADFLHLAADAGCASVSLMAQRLDINPFGFPDWSLVNDMTLRRETVRIAADLGVIIALGEGCAVLPGHDVTECLPVIEAFAELEVGQINLISFEPDLDRDFDQMCRFAELTGSFGVAVCAEFSARPGRPRLPSFIERTRAAGVAALIDAMHFFAAGQHASDLAQVPPERLTYLQLCDTRLDDIVDYGAAAFHERLAPGEGSLPLADLLAALPAGITVSMEIPQVSCGDVEAQRARVIALANHCRAFLA